MAVHHKIGFVVSLLLSINIYADTLELNPQHPDQYTVVQNDTLWDISAKFLKSPWNWHKLWHGNPQIKNPDLIYPGDTLYFSMEGGKPSLRVSPSKEPREVKLRPGIRKTSLDADIKTIPTDAISQFLTSARVLETDELDKAPYVIEVKGEHILGGAGDRVYVRSVLQPQTLDYTIYRKGQPYTSPETGEVLGFEALYVASATLEREGDPATLRVTRSAEEIREGDRVLPNSSSETALNYFPKQPKEQISGSIISVLNGVTQIGQHNVVVIDKGLVDGIKTGHVLTIYNKGAIVPDRYKSEDKTVMVRLPDEIAGALMVFRPFDRVSYALIMETQQGIHVFDRVRTPEE